MALSTEEHDLLVETCDNMNVAANTCRDVLEMLRSLGSTGVVDIATHNNSTGAHPNDTTIAHIVDNGASRHLNLGYAVQGASSLELWGGKSFMSVLFAGETKGGTVSMNFAGTEYLSDSNGDRVPFSDDSYASTRTEGYVITTFGGKLTDSTDKYVNSSISFRSNRNPAIGDGNGNHPYSCVRFMVASGTYSIYGNALEVNSFGVVPSANNGASLGHANLRFKDVYLVNQPNVSSDRRGKTEISSLGNSALELVKALNPVSYKLVDGETTSAQYTGDDELVQEAVTTSGVRTHWGFVAQDVKQALDAAGIEDAAVWCLADKNDPDSKQSLRYEELLAPLVKAVQILAAKVEALEAM